MIMGGGIWEGDDEFPISTSTWAATKQSNYRVMCNGVILFDSVKLP